jgi:guanyl-specific ribonuclease Sa
MTVAAVLACIALGTAAHDGTAAPVKKDSSPAFAALLQSAPADQGAQIAKDASSPSVAGAPAAVLGDPLQSGGNQNCTPSSDVAPNKEGGMPQEPNGYYLEYTLVVPGRKTGDGPVAIDVGGQTYMTGDMQSARGPERIIIGGHEHIYYTPDHYTTFIPLTIVR